MVGLVMKPGGRDKQRSDWDTGAEEMALGQDSWRPVTVQSQQATSHRDTACSHTLDLNGKEPIEYKLSKERFCREELTKGTRKLERWRWMTTVENSLRLAIGRSTVSSRHSK